MMKSISAIYENGVFKPKAPVNLSPGAEVDLLLIESEDDPVKILKARFPRSFGGLPPEDAAEMMKAIEEEFGRIDPDDWR